MYVLVNESAHQSPLILMDRRCLLLQVTVPPARACLRACCDFFDTFFFLLVQSPRSVLVYVTRYVCFCLQTHLRGRPSEGRPNCEPTAACRGVAYRGRSATVAAAAASERSQASDDPHKPPPNRKIPKIVRRSGNQQQKSTPSIWWTLVATSSTCKRSPSRQGQPSPIPLR